MWKKIPYDVKMSGNSWSIVDLMLTKPTLAFDCEEANQDSETWSVDGRYERGSGQELLVAFLLL